MNQAKPAIDPDRLSYKGSTILTAWKAEREASRNVIRNEGQFYRSSDPQVIELLGGRAASSGYRVTDETAQRVSAVAACIRILGGTIASLPLSIYERTDEGRKKVETPLWYLLNESPSPAWTAATMIEWWTRCNALRGDAVSQIERDRNGQPTGFLQWHPDRVQVETKAGQLHYYFQPKEGKAFGLFADDVLHIPGEGFNGERSLSVIQHAAHQSIGIALAADDFSGKFYKNGASPKHLITTDGKMSTELIDEMKRQYAEKYTGPENVGKPMVLTEGLKIESLSMSAVDAELLESRKYQVIDIARAFGVPPFMIGAQETSTSWGTGIEQQTLGFVKFTLQAYLNRIEQEINRKLFATPKHFVEFNLDGLLRGDSKAESEALRQARGGSQGPGWMTLNEVRRVKNLPPLPADKGGDDVYDPKGNEDAQETPPAAA